MRRAAALQAAEAHRAPRITAADGDGQDPALGAARAPRWHTLTRGRVLRTPLCDLLGIELPIVAAPMGPSISSAGDRRIVVRRPAHPGTAILGGAPVGGCDGGRRVHGPPGRPGRRPGRVGRVSTPRPSPARPGRRDDRSRPLLPRQLTLLTTLDE